MAIEGVAVVGLDLETQILRALSLAPPGDDYIIVRDLLVQTDGTIYAMRPRSVHVTSTFTPIVNAGPGDSVGSVRVDVIADVDISVVVGGIPRDRLPLLGLTFRTTIPLRWAGTRRDFVPPLGVDGQPFQYDNWRDRTEPRLAWAETMLPQIVDPLPKVIRPGFTVPGKVPVATWPDEYGIGPPSAATLVGNLMLPGAGAAPIENMLGPAVWAVVAQAVALPRALAAGFGGAGARAVTLDFQGSHVYCTAIPWSTDDIGSEPLLRSRDVWEALGDEWQPGQPWRRPTRLWISPALMEDSIRSLYGPDDHRTAVADGITEPMLRPFAPPNESLSVLPWLDWFVRDRHLGDGPEDPVDHAAWRLDHFLDLSVAERNLAIREYLDAVRSGVWPLTGELELPLVEDLEVVRIDAPSVRLVTRADMEEAFAANYPIQSPFFREQDLGFRVRMTVHAAYLGVHGNVEFWSISGIDPLFHASAFSRSDVDIPEDADLIVAAVLGAQRGESFGPMGPVFLGLMATWDVGPGYVSELERRAEGKIDEEAGDGVDLGEDALAGLFAKAAAADPTVADDPYLSFLAREFCGVDPAGQINRAQPMLIEAAASPEIGFSAAVDLASIPGVPFQIGVPQPISSGYFFFDEPVEVALGGSSPGVVRIHVRNRWDAETGEWLSVLLSPSGPTLSHHFVGYRLAPGAGLTNGEFLAADGANLKDLFDDEQFLPAEPLDFGVDDFEQDDVRWALHDEYYDRWIVGVTTRPTLSNVSVTELLERKVVADLERARRERAFEDVTTAWWGNLADQTIRSLRLSPAGSLEAVLAGWLTAELLRFAVRLQANPLQIQATLDQLSLFDVRYGDWAQALEAAFGGRLEFSHDDEFAAERMRAWVARYLADRATMILGAGGAVGDIAKALAAIEALTRDFDDGFPPVEQPIAPMHFVRAVPGVAAVEGRLVSFAAVPVGDPIPRPGSPDSNVMETVTVETFPEWRLSFRVGLRGDLDLGGALTISLDTVGDAGVPTTVVQVAPVDVTATTIPQGAAIIVDETLTARITVPYTVPANLVAVGLDETLRIDLIVSTAGGFQVTDRKDLPFRRVTRESTAEGRRVRDQAASQDAHDMWAAANHNANADAGMGRPDVDHLLGGFATGSVVTPRERLKNRVRESIARKFANWLGAVEDPGLPPRPDR